MNDDYQFNAASGQELFSARFRTWLKGLNGVVAGSGVPLEGNLFYLNHRRREKPVDANTDIPDDQFKNKRANFVSALKGKTKLVEIGFNAGHSALLALATNRELLYFGIDIARYFYTKPCAMFLSATFPGRVEVAFGDSARMFPLHAFSKFLDCDIIHIDGGHSVELFTVDMVHAITLPNPLGLSRHVLVDDAQASHIEDKLKEFLESGFIVPEKHTSSWRGRENQLFRIVSK
jgi:hypothetical protein